MKLDMLDWRLLAALQRDGRMTKLKLAEHVNLSPSACWDRLHRLEAAGVITGYAAQIALDKLLRLTTVIVEITLKSHRHIDFQIFETAVHAEPQIVECLATGGGIDYVLRAVASDIEGYQRLIDRLLTADIGIDRYFTYVVTKAVKSATLPVAHIQTIAEATAVRHE